MIFHFHSQVFQHLEILNNFTNFVFRNKIIGKGHLFYRSLVGFRFLVLNIPLHPVVRLEFPTFILIKFA